MATTNFESWNRPFKNAARIAALPTNNPRTSIWLCGHEMLDFQLAIAQGRLQPDGNHVVVERDRECVKLISGLIPSLAIKPKLVSGDLDKMHVSDSVEYANLDFLGSITLRLAEWLEELPVADNAEICITILHHHARRNQFMPLCKRIVETLPIYKHYSRLSRLKMIDDDAIVFHQTLFACLFRKYDYLVDVYSPYKDVHYNMVLYKLHGFRHAKHRVPHDDLVALVKASMPCNFVDEDGVTNEEFDEQDMNKVQQIVTKLADIVAIKNRKTRYDKIRGLNRQITVFSEQVDNSDYVRHYINQAITKAGLDPTCLENNTLWSGKVSS